MPAFEKLKVAVTRISLDWMKYAANSWILYTYESPDSVYHKLMREVPELAPLHILTFYMDNSSSKSGQQVNWVWEWLNKHR